MAQESIPNKELVEKFAMELYGHLQPDLSHATSCASIAQEYAREMSVEKDKQIYELEKEVDACKRHIAEIVRLSEQPGGYHP